MAIREKILIIGNGFDLYHSLPTMYSQFINVLINIETLNLDNDKEIVFEDLFANIWNKSEMEFRYDTEKMIFDKEKLIKIKNILIVNQWFKSFKEKLSFENWIDVENEIKTTLKIINKIVNKINEVIIDKGGINSMASDWMYLKFLNPEEYKYLHYFNFHLNNGPSIKKELFKITNNIFIEFKKEEFYENLYVELQNFIHVFNIYLESIVGLFYEKIDSKYLSTLENLNKQINKFYTFNYTPTLEKLYKIENEKVDYIHGKHNSENHSIVLGIDDVDESFINDKIFMFSKYYQKLFNDTDYKFLSNMKTQNSKSFTSIPTQNPHISIRDGFDSDFILFGHSLAENDQNYLIELFEIGKLRTNTITVFYYNISDKTQKLKNLLKIIGRENIENFMKSKKLTFRAINEKPFETIFKSLPKSFPEYQDRSPEVY